MTPVRIAIFASGTGSNAEALIKKSQQESHIKIEFVLSDKATAAVLAKAAHLNVETYLLEKNADRKIHEEGILTLLKKHQVDWIFLAGYMRLISADFLKTFEKWHDGQSQVVNIHPSLLPAYPGAKALERAFADHVPESGVTIHRVDEGMDTGPILKQEKIKLLPEENFPEFAARVHAVEHRLYCEFLGDVAQGKVKTQKYNEVTEC